MAPRRQPNAPPSHLEGRGLALFEAIVGEYQLEAHHLQALTLAAEQAMRAESAAKIVAVEGVVAVDRFGQVREHPAVATERLAATACARLLRELGLDMPGAK